MKTNLSILFNFFGTFVLGRSIQQGQSLPHIFFENASPNNTFVFGKEYSQNAFCEYDSCHLVLDPAGSQQWVAFSTENASETITYQICETAGRGAVKYGVESPQCTYYSGVDVNVTSTLGGVIAVTSDNSVNVLVNGTSSPFQVTVTFSALESAFPSYAPTKNPIFSKKTRSTDPLWALAIVTIGLFVALCIKYGINQHADKKSPLLLEDFKKQVFSKNASYYCCSIFSRAKEARDFELTIDNRRKL
jgi:hypothetical protein